MWRRLYNITEWYEFESVKFYTCKYINIDDVKYDIYSDKFCVDDITGENYLHPNFRFELRKKMFGDMPLFNSSGFSSLHLINLTLTCNGLPLAYTYTHDDIVTIYQDFNLIKNTKTNIKNYINAITNLKLIKDNFDKIVSDDECPLSGDTIKLIINLVEKDLINSNIYVNYCKFVDSILIKDHKIIIKYTRYSIYNEEHNKINLIPLNYDNLSFLNHYKSFLNKLIELTDSVFNQFIEKNNYKDIKYEILQLLLDKRMNCIMPNVRKFKLYKNNKGFTFPNDKVFMNNQYVKGKYKKPCR